MMMKKISGLLLGAVMLVSCGEFHQIMKNDDYHMKYDKAREYYNRGEYKKAQELFDAVRSYYIGQHQAQIIAYYRAFCSANLKSYEEAAEYFRLFLQQYPESSFAQECLYMVGYCGYLSMPNPRLDMSVAEQAIRDFQLYLTRYPGSDRKEKINEYMDIMRDRLSYKAYLGAENYYKRERWTSAIISLGNCLKDYPGSKYREEIMYMLFNSKYELAVNSIESKQYERFSEAREEYYFFVDEYPNSRFARDLTRKSEVIARFMDKYNFSEEFEE